MPEQYELVEIDKDNNLSWLWDVLDYLCNTDNLISNTERINLINSLCME